jgi:hypothetical protein
VERMRRLLPLALVAAAAVVATLAVNFLLVGYAQDRDDPVGKLSPRALITQADRGRTGPTSTEGRTTTGSTTTGEDDDDSSGRGRGRGRGGDDDGGSDDD